MLGGLLALLATLALLEVGTRALLPQRSYEAWRQSSLRYVHHPVYHWSLRPGEYRSVGGPIRVNSLGLRGDEVATEKAPDALRVLCLGGSSTFNYHAAGGRTWPARLEEHLARALGRPVEVINAGTPGYSSYQSSVRFEHQLAALQPDLVLVYHLWNDLKLFWIEDVDAVVAQWERHGRFNEASTLLDPFPFLDALCAHSQFVTHARFAEIALLKKLRGLEHEEGWIHRKLDKRVSETGLGFYRSNLERVARVAAERGIALGIIDQPILARPDNTPRQRRRIRYDYTGFDHPRLVEAVQRGWRVNREVARRPGAWHLGTNAFPRDLAHMRDHVHLTDRGLARLAAVIGPQVAAMARARGAAPAATNQARRHAATPVTARDARPSARRGGEDG